MSFPADWQDLASDTKDKAILYAFQSLVNGMLSQATQAAILTAEQAIQANTQAMAGGANCYYLPANTASPNFGATGILRIVIQVDGTNCTTLTQGAQNARTKQNLNAGTLYRNTILTPDAQANGGLYDSCQFDQPVMLYLNGVI